MTPSLCVARLRLSRETGADDMNEKTPPSLVLSFWDIALGNFPAGTLRHRMLPRDEATRLINEVKDSGTLSCGTNEDLGAPYKSRALKKVQELTGVLSEQLGVNIQVKDFFEADEDGARFATPISLFDIRSDRPMIVVTCNYTWDRTPQDGDLGLSINPESVTFHLFELVA